MSSQRAHRWWQCTLKGLKWLTFCRGCGLVALRNARTQSAMRAGCDGGDEGEE